MNAVKSQSSKPYRLKSPWHTWLALLMLSWPQILSLSPVGRGGGVAEEGFIQGDIPSGAFFCVAQKSSLVKLDQECQVGGGFTKG